MSPGLIASSMAGQGARRSEPVLDLVGDLLASRTTGLSLRLHIDRAQSSDPVPASSEGFSAGQNSTRPVAVCAQRCVSITRSPRRSGRSRAAGSAKDRIDEREIFRRRAARGGQRLIDEKSVRAAFARSSKNWRRLISNCARIGALEAEDRLFLVAHGERRARRCAPMPSPAKNSSVRLWTISHCWALVSCASSIRMWSMPSSSL